MLHPVRVNQSKGILKSALMELYLKNVGQGTNSLKHSKKRGCILSKNFISRLNKTH